MKEDKVRHTTTTRDIRKRGEKRATGSCRLLRNHDNHANGSNRLRGFLRLLRVRVARGFGGARATRSLLRLRRIRRRTPEGLQVSDAERRV